MRGGQRRACGLYFLARAVACAAVEIADLVFHAVVCHASIDTCTVRKIAGRLTASQCEDVSADGHPHDFHAGRVMHIWKRVCSTPVVWNQLLTVVRRKAGTRHPRSCPNRQA